MQTVQWYGAKWQAELGLIMDSLPPLKNGSGVDRVTISSLLAGCPSLGTRQEG